VTQSRYPCHCCGYLTLDQAPTGTYDICKVCFWEDDPVQSEDPSYPGGANGVSLEEARANFRRLGVSEGRFQKHVRPPRPEEMPPS
jgi:Cysteine-rich CPCC